MGGAILASADDKTLPIPLLLNYPRDHSTWRYFSNGLVTAYDQLKIMNRPALHLTRDLGRILLDAFAELILTSLATSPPPQSPASAHH